MTKTQRLAGLALAAASASAETPFKIVTVKDDITVGLNDAELKELGGDAHKAVRANHCHRRTASYFPAENRKTVASVSQLAFSPAMLRP